jgi:DNA-binding CsgD family transcriptional regulator
MRYLYALGGKMKVLSKKPKGNSQDFTHRERKIIKLIAEGYNDQEVAEDLCISIRAVKNYENSLMKKMDLHDISSVIDYALRKGLITVYEILESRFLKTHSAKFYPPSQNVPSGKTRTNANRVSTEASAQVDVLQRVSPKL